MAVVKQKFEEFKVPVDIIPTCDVGLQNYIEKQVVDGGFSLDLLGYNGDHSKLRRTLIGIVFEYVLNSVNCVVLIVK